MPIYIKSLKECLIETYTSIVFSVKEMGDTSGLDTCVTGIFGYLEKLSTQAGNDLDFMKQVLALITDLAGLYGRKIQALLTAEFVAKMLAVLEASANKEHKKIAQWSQKVINKALSSN